MPAKRKKFTITVNARPTPKGRPRLGRRGRVFTPIKTLEAEAVIRDAWKKARGPMWKEEPVWIEIRLFYDRTEITVGVDEDEGYSRLRGDIDNYVKLVMDGLNGAAWADDKQVHKITSWKEKGK